MHLVTVEIPANNDLYQVSTKIESLTIKAKIESENLILTLKKKPRGPNQISKNYPKKLKAWSGFQNILKKISSTKTDKKSVVKVTVRTEIILKDLSEPIPIM